VGILDILMASLVKWRWEVWMLARASVLPKSVLCLASVDCLATADHLFSSLIPDTIHFKILILMLGQCS
jgi:hypothetical protein